jgi:hypothetical protein
MFETKEIIVGLLTFCFTMILFWRLRRNEKRKASGQCYNCGGTLFKGKKSVTLWIRAPEVVDFCLRCHTHRKVWGWLVANLIFVFALIAWYGIAHS